MKRTTQIVSALALGLVIVNLAAADTWTRKADMPMARTLCGAATVNGKVYVIGGGRSWYESSPPAAVYVYDPATDTWESKADMPTPRVTVAAVALDRKIYAVGGVRGQTALRTLEVYDPDTDTWEKKADMLTARAWLGATAAGGMIYAVGGWPSMASVEMYDPVTDTWAPRSNMPAGRHVFGISAVGGKIYVIGGEGGASTASPNVFEYDPIADRWTEQADMPSGRYCQSTGVVNGKIYVFGGDSLHGGGGPGLSVVEVYDPATNTWRKGADMSSPRTETCAAVVDGRIYVIGGSPRSADRPLSVVEEYTVAPVVDFNADFVIDIDDLLLLIEHWAGSEPTFDVAPWPSADGIIDAQDLEVLMSSWGQELDDPRLLAHWKLDETEGLIAHDSAGSYDGTLAGDPLWQPTGGKLGGALLFDGVDDCVTTEYIRDTADGPFSVFAWVKGGAPGQTIVSQTSGANWLMADPTQGLLMTELKGAGRFSRALCSQTTITDGAWHRVGLVWDGSNRILYVDDVEVARDAQSSLAGTYAGLHIGAGKALEPSSFFAGLIDDVRLYNRAVVP